MALLDSVLWGSAKPSDGTLFMRFNLEAAMWITAGGYFFLAGLGQLPIARQMVERYDKAGGEQYRAWLRLVVAPIFLISGSLLLVHPW